jgi:hypothetical protein
VPVSVDAYRARLEAMSADFVEEEYCHFAGLKPTLELAAVDEEYAELFTLEAYQGLVEASAPAELLRAAAEGYLGTAARPLTDRASGLENELAVPLDGETVPFRAVPPRIANEPDARRRRALHAGRCELTEHELLPILAEAEAVRRERVRDLGAPDFRTLAGSLGPDLDRLLAQTRPVLAETEGLYDRELDRALRARVGRPLEQAGPQDVARLWRAPEFDTWFPADRALPALRATLLGLGIDLDRQPNLHLDLEPRPGKLARAFCAPILVPDRVMLVILPQGGHDDWLALFHEAGHAEHFCHMSPTLPAEARVRGDNAVTEGWAFLFDQLPTSPTWLAARLTGTPDGYPRFAALEELYFLRRYCGKLAYELELHGGAPLESLAGRYAEHLTAATHIPHPPGDCLSDVDPWLYCTFYLRAWAFQAQLEHHLERRFGRGWFRRRRAGVLVRELWELGQSLTADELLHQTTGDELSFEPLLERLRERLG